MSNNPFQKKECLLKKFEFLKKQYVKAFKAKLYDVYMRLGTELIDLANKIKKEFGLKFSDLGLTSDGEYILRCVRMVAENPMSEFADTILADAMRLKCADCDGKCCNEVFSIMKPAPTRNVDIGAR